MRTTPLFLMRASVPDTVSGSRSSTWARDGVAAANAATAMSAATKRTARRRAATRRGTSRRVAAPMGLLRRRGGSRRQRMLERRALVEAGLFRTQVAFPLGDHRGGHRIADHVGGAA